MTRYYHHQFKIFVIVYKIKDGRLDRSSTSVSPRNFRQLPYFCVGLVYKEGEFSNGFFWCNSNSIKYKLMDDTMSILNSVLSNKFFTYLKSKTRITRILNGFWSFTLVINFILRFYIIDSQLYLPPTTVTFAERSVLTDIVVMSTGWHTKVKEREG